MTLDAGRVLIELDTADGLVKQARVRSERPPVARALGGKPAKEAVALVPLIFALCGRAQGRAAVGAAGDHLEGRHRQDLRRPAPVPADLRRDEGELHRW